MTNITAHGTEFALPSGEELLEAYHQLYKIHPHDLVSLEGELPAELRPESRDKYRVIMTMILSDRTWDYTLLMSLGKLFSDCPNMNSFRGIYSWNDVKDLLKQYGFQVDGPGKLNVARFWRLITLYFGKWNQTISPENIKTLSTEYGYDPQFMRTLYAYVLGRPDFLPLNAEAFEVLVNVGLYDRDRNIDAVSADVENKLSGEQGILIDLHEMLLFLGQTSGKRVRERKEIVIGWNAWKLLCSNERKRITQDWKWIHQRLIKDEYIAEDLWYFYRKITNS